MILDYFPTDNSQYYDLCIIGAGPAGISIALAFINTPYRVCLLEAGGLQPPLLDDKHPYQGVNVGRSYDMLRTRLRYFGGSSGHWGGWCRPLDDVDFMYRDYIPLSGWPIDRDDLLPDYKKALSICEVDTAGFGIEAFDNQHSSEPFLHNKLDNCINKNLFFSSPTRFGQRYRQQIIDAKNIDCFLNSTVVELIQPKEKVENVVVRVEQEVRLLQSQFIVVATGGIETPRLLLHSTRHYPKGLGNLGDYVGRCFSDHIGRSPASAVLPLSGSYHRRFGPINKKTSQLPRLSFDKDTLTKNRLVNFAIGFDKITNSDQGSNKISDILQGLQPQKTALEYYNLFIALENTPNPNSRVMLDKKKDANGMYQVKLDWRINDIDVESIGRIVKLFSQLVGQHHLGRVKDHQLSFEETKMWSSYQAHHLGTTRMADNVSQGVVDSDCKVFGSKNLYIAGSSVFPTYGFANPTLTIVALASRLASHLKQIMHYG